MKILVTGFDPFGGETLNPSWEAVKALPDQIGGAEIHKLEVPTEFAASGEVLAAALARIRPEAVLCVGQAGGNAGLAIERVGINLREARIPDNAGFSPMDEPVISGGPNAYFSTLPVKEMAGALREAGIPAKLSYSAGTYVCNNLLYTLLHLAAEKYPRMQGGFIHVPFLPEQAAGKSPSTPSMELSTIARGLETALRVIAEA